ncbi:hypothetical protein GS483_19590 [Rhodococcus hoagii]|nr:hypothetical protein [Prescottella equi]
MRDLREFHDPDLYLPIGGKTYRITSPNAEDGLRLRALFAEPGATFTDDDQVAEIKRLFGATRHEHIVDVPVFDDEGQPVIDPATGVQRIESRDVGRWVGGVWEEMNADGVSWPEIMHAGTTAMLHYGQGATLAEIYWETGMGDIEGNRLPPAPKTATGGTRSSNPQARKTAKRNRRRKN